MQYIEYGERHGAYIGGIRWCATCCGPGASPHRWHSVCRLVIVHPDGSEHRSKVREVQR